MAYGQNAPSCDRLRYFSHNDEIFDAFIYVRFGMDDALYLFCMFPLSLFFIR